MSEHIPSTLMVDLDSLFDTRFGTMILYMYDELEHVFSKNMYHNRLDDSFNKFIDKDQFYSYYSRRDKKVLHNSGLSLIADIIRDFVVNIGGSDPASPYTYYPRIYINTYPYELTSIEIDNISIGVSKYYKDKAVVEMVYMSPANISTSFVKENITVLIMYEYHKWLDVQAETDGFKKISCSDTTLFGPRMFFKEVPLTKDKVDETFTLLEAISKPFINLELLPSIFFSTYLKPKGKSIFSKKEAL